MTLLKVEKYDEAFIRIFTDKSTEQELSDFFTFPVPGAKFMPKFKAKIWDGKARLYNLQTKKLYAGLIDYVKEFVSRNDYELEIADDVEYDMGITVEQVEGFAKVINPCSKGNPIEIRDYQVDAIHKALNNCRTVLLSPTASGKSLIIYTLLRWFLAKGLTCIIIVPTTSLVEQLYSDFEDYSTGNGWRTDDNCQKLYSGLSKDFTSNVLITTWQSTFKLSKDWCNQFDVVFSDECIHPDTLITTDLGQIKISNISVGDLVLTLNEDTKIYEYKPILKVHKNISVNEKKFKITYDDGTFIIITGNHKQYTQRGWVRTDELTIEDMVLSFVV